MAVTSARDNEKFAKRPKVGASGAFAPEGYGASHLVGVSGFVGEEGVVTRGKEGDEKRFAEAKKVMEAFKKEDGGEAVAAEKAKEAEKKPTAPGVEVSKLESGKGQPAKATEKEEVKTVEASKPK